MSALRIKCIVCWLIASTTITGCRARSERADEIVSEARAHLDRQEYSEAIALLDRAVRIDPQNANAFLWRGAAYLMKDQPHEAIADCRRAIELDPNSAVAFHNRGQAQFLLGRGREALADWDRALALNPQYTSTYASRGEYWFEKGQYEESAEDFALGIRCGPPTAQLYAGRGKALGRLGRFREAVDDLTSALQLDANNPGVLFLRAHYRLQQAQYKEALDDVLKVVDLDPEDDVAHQMIAGILAFTADELQDLPRALQYAQRACELNGDKVSAHWKVLAMIHAKQGNLAEAARCQQKAIDIASEGFDLEQARLQLREFERELAQHGPDDPQSAPSSTQVQGSKMNQDAMLAAFRKDFSDATLEWSKSGSLHCWWRGIHAVLSDRPDEYVLTLNLADNLKPGNVSERINDCRRYPKGPYKYDDERFATVAARIIKSYDAKRDVVRFVDDQDFGWLMAKEPDDEPVRWQGVTQLVFFGGKEVVFYLESDVTGATDEQRRWFQQFRANQAALRTMLEPLIFKHYETCRDYGYDVPDLHQPQQVWAHLNPSSLTLRDAFVHGDSSMVAVFHWHCSWDDEHGCWALLQDGRFTRVGDSP